MGFVRRHWDKFVYGALGVLGSAGVASAELTMPTLPTTDLETAGTAVLGLIAVGVIIGMIARALRKAG